LEYFPRYLNIIAWPDPKFGLNIKIGIRRLIKKFEKNLSVKPCIDLTLLIEEGMPVWPGATSGDQGTHDPWERHLHPPVDPV